jgi:hypothetical protein
MTPLAICAAARFEVEPLLLRLQQQGTAHEFFECGIGSLHAARLCERLSPVLQGRDVLLVGTCGTFGSDPHLALVRARLVRWLPTCVRHELAYSVKGVEPDIALPPPLALFADLPARDVLCGPTISLSARLPSGLDPSQTVENLEAYSVASTLLPSVKSLTILLAITNLVGPDAHAQWLARRDEAARLTAVEVSQRLSGGV